MAGDMNTLFDLSNLDKQFLETRTNGFASRTKYNVLGTSTYNVDVIYMSESYKTRKHYHRFKYNRIYVLYGKLQVTIFKGGSDSDLDVRELGPECDIRKIDIFPGTIHQLKALEPTVILEVDSVRCLPNDMETIMEFTTESSEQEQ